RVNPAGNVTSNITLFNETNVVADHSDLTTLANGNFVAVFEAFAGSSPRDIFFTIRNNAGNLVVSPTPVVGAGDPADETVAHVAALADGGFVVTWTDEAGDADGEGIRASGYSANGTVVQGKVLVNVFNQKGRQFDSDVTALPAGRFVVAWEDSFDDVDRAQRFDEAGNLVGTPFTFGVDGDISSAATYSDGRAIVTLNVLGDGIDVQTWILDTRVTDANQTTGENFF